MEWREVMKTARHRGQGACTPPHQIIAIPLSSRLQFLDFEIHNLPILELCNMMNEMVLNHDPDDELYYRLRAEYMARDGQKVYRELHS